MEKPVGERPVRPDPVSDPGPAPKKPLERTSLDLMSGYHFEDGDMEDLLNQICGIASTNPDTPTDVREALGDLQKVVDQWGNVLARVQVGAIEEDVEGEDYQLMRVYAEVVIPNPAYESWDQRYADWKSRSEQYSAYQQQKAEWYAADRPWREWELAQRVRARLLKRRVEIEAELAQLNRQLGETPGESL